MKYPVYVPTCMRNIDAKEEIRMVQEHNVTSMHVFLKSKLHCKGQNSPMRLNMALKYNVHLYINHVDLIRYEYM